MTIATLQFLVSLAATVVATGNLSTLRVVFMAMLKLAVNVAHATGICWRFSPVTASGRSQLDCPRVLQCGYCRKA